MNVHRPKTGSSVELLHEHRDIARGKLRLSLVITLIVMIVEVVGGILTNSLALISDAGHMFTHVFALGISLMAISISSKDPCHHRTYGFYRAEILAALFNSIFLFIITAFIVYESIKRFIEPKVVNDTEMFFIALLGLAVNVASVLILKGSEKEDLNIKGAFLHMLSDTFSSVAIIIGAVIIRYTGWNFIDPILSILIAVVILLWAQKLLRDSINILMEGTPKGVFIDEVEDTIKTEIPEIKEITDLHVWQITSNMYSMSAHVKVGNIDVVSSRKLLDKINKLLNDRYDIEHTTVQFDV